MSTVSSPAPYILDVEASGFGPRGYPIEVGVALEPGRRWSALIRPEPEWDHWDPQAESVHGIARATLREHGAPARVVADSLNARLQGATVYTDGWVVDFPWLVELFRVAAVEMRFRVSALEMILTESQLACWARVKAMVCEELALPRHRASTDAWLVQETYVRSAAIARQVG